MPLVCNTLALDNYDSIGNTNWSYVGNLVEFSQDVVRNAAFHLGVSGFEIVKKSMTIT